MMAVGKFVKFASFIDAICYLVYVTGYVIGG